jgi:hypothetical protein
MGRRRVEWTAHGLRHGCTIWRSNDLEVACAMANSVTRLLGMTGLSSEQRWDSRQPFTATQGGVYAGVDHTATRRAMNHLGHLSVLRRPIRTSLESNNGQKRRADTQARYKSVRMESFPFWE